MPVHLLNDELRFPPPEGADGQGIVAVGGDASAARLELAYSQGIFPWPMEGLPLLWFSPDPRFVLFPEGVHLGRTLKRTMRRGRYEVRMDTRFREVIERAAKAPRPGQDGTWITDEIIAGFTELHDMGVAHSVETYVDGELVGGLYGVSLGAAFFGESMFATEPDASKVAFASLLGHAFGPWSFSFVDCQVYTEHLARFGAMEIHRTAFLEDLADARTVPTRRHPWEVELTAEEVLDVLSG
ncbi:MAG: leucyl/phenylalanyl-tRNA--protein transferase [Deltaproteobacteria bacterium]|nr:leucyl/phenylalanyl-tRNA--protein transferase [Deltaproteobacteria bacterium]